MLGYSLLFQITAPILVINRIIKLAVSDCLKVGGKNMLVLPAGE